LLADRLAPEQARAVESHLRECPQCRGLLASIQDQTVIARKGPAREPSGPDAETSVAATDEDTEVPPVKPPASNPTQGNLSAAKTDEWLGTSIGGSLVNRIFQSGSEAEAGQGAADRPFPDTEWLSTPRSAPEHKPPPGVPGYEIVRELGRGGMGVVYLARDVRLKRPVALKMLLGGTHAEQADLARFRAEAEVVARLRHPNIVQIYEIGEINGLPYLALEYLPGGVLYQKLQGKPQAPREAAGVIEVLARAIQHAHDQGIVHRDLKPANVLLSNAEVPLSQSAPKITDFGLAKLVDSVDGRTRAGDIVGTPGYLAPEQAEGNPHQVGPPADIYALGILLYEMLTGRPPFQAGTPLDTVMLVRLQEAVPPRRFQPRLERDLDTITLKCLQKEPQRRYGRAADLADDLRRFLDGQPILARPAGYRERLLKWTRRNPALAALSASTLAAVLLGFLGILLSLREVSQRAESETAARAVAEKQRARANAERRNAELRTARGFLERGVGLCEAGEVGRGLVLLAHALKLLESLQAEGEADEDEAHPTRATRDHLDWLTRSNLACWQQRLPIRLRASLTHADWVWDVAFTPDGQRAVTAGKDRVVRFWNAETGEPAGEPLQVGEPVWAVRISPDGKRLLTAQSREPDGYEAQLWNLADGRKLGPALPHQVLGSPLGVLSNLGFSPDGNTVFSQSDAQTLQFFDAATGQSAGPPWRLRHPVLMALWSHDGQTFITGDGEGFIRRWSRSTGLPLGEPTKLSGPVTTLALSRDGKVLISGCWSVSEDTKKVTGGEARVWDAATGEALGPVWPQPGPVKTAVFSPDGRLCLTGGLVLPPLKDGKPSAEQPTGWAQLQQTATGQKLVTLPHELAVWSAAFTGDGRRMITGCEDRVGHVWSVPAGFPLGPQPWIPGNKGSVRAIAVHPNGRTILQANTVEEAGARLLDIVPEQMAAAPLPHPGRVLSLAFRPDGRTLLTACEDGTLRVWDPQTGALLAQRQASPNEPRPRLLSPDGRRALAWAQQGEQEFRCQLWDLLQQGPGASPQIRANLKLDRPGVTFVFSGDGRWLAGASQDTPLTNGKCNTSVRVWDAATGKIRGVPLVFRDVPGPVNSLVILGEGKTVLAAVNHWHARQPWVWNVDSGAVLRSFPLQPDTVTGLAGHGHGRTLVTLEQGHARVWEAGKDTPHPVGVILLHRQAVQDTSFSPDGRLVLTASGRQAAVWDPLTGLRLGSSLDQDAQVRLAAFRPDGRMIATAGDNHQVRLWHMPPPLEGPAERIQCWVEAITRLHLEMEPTEAVLPLDDVEVGKRYRRLQAEWGGGL
jgi:serine/threonine protein kinase/WD40 repeat protein